MTKYACNVPTTRALASYLRQGVARAVFKLSHFGLLTRPKNGAYEKACQVNRNYYAFGWISANKN